jgi:hypothetical protein
VGRAPGTRLHQDIAQRGRRSRPCDHREAARVGGELAQQLVVRAATDDVHDFNFLAEQP